MKKLVLLVLCAACHRAKPVPVETTRVVAPPPATTSVTGAPSASAVAPRVLDPAAVAKRWNDALNTSDMNALSALYADKVKYYGATFDRATLVKKVAATLAKKPYHQEIEEVDHWRVKNGIRVQFHKRFGSHTEKGGYLILDPKTLLILEESDMTTDDTLLLAGKCIPYNQTVTVTGDLSHAMGPPNDDYWVIALDERVCVMDEDGGGRSACELPEAQGDIGTPSEATTYSMTGTFESTKWHQECGFFITRLRAIGPVTK